MWLKHLWPTSCTLSDIMIQMTTDPCICLDTLPVVGFVNIFVNDFGCICTCGSVSHRLLCLWSSCCAATALWFAFKSLMDHASNHRTSTSTGGGTGCISENGLSLCQVVCRLSCSVLGASFTHMGTQTYLLTKSMRLAKQVINDTNRHLSSLNKNLHDLSWDLSFLSADAHCDENGKDYSSRAPITDT